ncbi:MAG TPA: RNA polymerase sigma-70 factor [Chitinophagaceae bacterium]|jgi:RNA polymerase sigma-70 factor (ECF subfamily)|nr:RNA polymerase sigma-70 factor [Chitinophagaceae bacterium]
MSFHITSNDNDLQLRLTQGDQRAFTEIYHRYWDKLLAIAFNHTRDRSLAEDIVQNLFVNLWERSDNLDIDNLDHYLATAVKFAVFKEYYRKQKRESTLLSKLSVEEEELIDERISAKFLEEYIFGIADHLPEKCRLVFRYSRMNHMNIREIADRMGINTKTVEAHLTKALKTIRRELRGTGLIIILIILSDIFFI